MWLGFGVSTDNFVKWGNLEISLEKQFLAKTMLEITTLITFFILGASVIFVDFMRFYRLCKKRLFFVCKQTTKLFWAQTIYLVCLLNFFKFA